MKKCGITELSEGLVSRLRVFEVSLPLDVLELPQDQIVSYIRSKFTNSGVLLRELALFCTKHWNSPEDCDWDHEQSLKCPLLADAYQLIETASIDIAMDSYEEIIS